MRSLCAWLRALCGEPSGWKNQKEWSHDLAMTLVSWPLLKASPGGLVAGDSVSFLMFSRLLRQIQGADTLETLGEMN